MPSIKDWPASAVQMVPVSQLIPYARNARTHSDEQVAQIAASIREFGWTNPVLIDGENGIIAGHGRIMAARKLDVTDVPAIVLGHLTDAQKRALVIADNKLALNAGWDLELLSIELNGLDNEKFNLHLLGFEPGELTEIMFEPEFEPGSEDDQGRLDQKAPITCPKCGHEFIP